MDVIASGWSPDRFILKKGVPVRWIINGRELTGCNNEIQVPKLGLSFKIKQEEQTIEFTPNEEGTISWSCWMGMIRGIFIVKKDLNFDSPEDIKKELSYIPATEQGDSCTVGGSCGCGG